MKPLTEEMHRVLLKRIASAIGKARYEPGTVRDEAAAAAEVLRPYAPREKKDGWPDARELLTAIIAADDEVKAAGSANSGLPALAKRDHVIHVARKALGIEFLERASHDI